jgi:hypothetical protein
VKHLRKALSRLVTLAEAAAELHVASAATATAIAELLDTMHEIQEAKPTKR